MANELMTLKQFEQWCTARGAHTRIRFKEDKYHVLIAGQKPGRGTLVVLVPGRALVAACIAAQAAYDLEPVCAAS